MGKEDGKTIFRRQMAAAIETAETAKFQDSKLLQAKTSEEDRLISKFDDIIKKDLQLATIAYLQQEPIASILSIFDATVETIADRENKKITTTRTHTHFYIEPLGYVNGELELKREEKLKFTCFIEGKPVETLLGTTKIFDKDSIVGLIEGFEVSFSGLGPFILLNLNDGFLTVYVGDIKTRIALEEVNLESLAKHFADTVIHRKYIPEPLGWDGNVN